MASFIFNDLPLDLQTVLEGYAKNPLTYWNNKNNKELNDLLSAFKSFEESENMNTAKNIKAVIKSLETRLSFANQCKVLFIFRVR